jgi:hypothetical protein
MEDTRDAPGDLARRHALQGNVVPRRDGANQIGSRGELRPIAFESSSPSQLASAVQYCERPQFTDVGA